MPLQMDVRQMDDKEMLEALSRFTSFLPYHGNDYRLAKDIENLYPRILSTSPSTSVVSKLDDEIGHMDRLLNSMKQSVERRKLAIRRLRNRCLPINGLPLEILIEIFLIVQLAGKKDGDNYYKSVSCLAGVSSRWLRIAISTPQLWIHLSSSHSSLFTKEKLQRSGNSPLHIYIPPSSNRRARKRAEHFIKILIPFSARWKTFNNRCGALNARLCNNELRPRVPLPLLQAFSSFSELTLQDELPAWVLESSPRLHTLSIPDFSFPMKPTVLYHLRNITFSPVVQGVPFTPDHWNIFLSSSPNLESIELHGGNLPDTAVSLPSAVHLPRLRRILFRKISKRTTFALLDAITTTLGVYPSIIIEGMREVDIKSFFKLLFPGTVSSGSLLALMRDIRWISVDCTDPPYGLWKPYITAGRETPQGFLYLSFIPGNHSLPSLVLQGIASSFGSWLEELDISIDDKVEGPYLADVLPSLQAIQRLSLREVGHKTPRNEFATLDHVSPYIFRPGSIIPDIVALSTPDYSRPEGAWVCPKLTHLTIEGTDLLQAVTLFAETRYGFRGGSLETQPVPLKVLRLAILEQGNRHQTIDAGLVTLLNWALSSQGTLVEIIPLEEDRELTMRRRD
ncbi:hypothetical protein FRC02_009567 [Tulasnella sp. 418]|nr:hypothetical protein FRC02_009567 [Tulasnella sp. 418]